MTRRELGRDAFTLHDPAWLSASEADALLAELLATMPWVHRPIVIGGREIPQPRLMTWGGELPYRYSGQTLEPRPMPDALAAITARVVELVGVPFNHVVLNLYRDGKDSIGMHADDERELGWNPQIAALSLGAVRTFVLAPKDKRRKRDRLEVPLEHGSLFVMGGNLQHAWYHGVPKQPSVQGPRINVTWRLLKGPPGWREPWPGRPVDATPAEAPAAP